MRTSPFAADAEPSGGPLQRSHRVTAVFAALLLLLLAAMPAQARVDFVEETHFRCYIVSQQTPEPAKAVTLSDQFVEDATVTIDEPLQFCAPTSKNGAEIEEPDQHLTMYAAPFELTPHLTVWTEDQFGPRTLEVVGARVLLVPTQKQVGGLEFPDRLNHYWCYEANGDRADVRVTLEDQFGGPDTVRVEQPVLFCNPVVKVHDGERFRIQERQVHLTCYDLHGPQRTEPTEFPMTNQLETDSFTVTAFELLCVPAEKLGFEPSG